MSMKNPLTLAGIEPATFRFVAQHNYSKVCQHNAVGRDKTGVAERSEGSTRNEETEKKQSINMGRT